MRSSLQSLSSDGMKRILPIGSLWRFAQGAGLLLLGGCFPVQAGGEVVQSVDADRMKVLRSYAYTWSNGKGGEWEDSANWEGGRRPNEKETEWVQYEFEEPRKISGVKVYWHANGGDRRVPESWRILYRHQGEWKPAEALGSYPVELDQFNEVKFKVFEADRIRLETHLQPGVSAGIHEWRILPQGVR